MSSSNSKTTLHESSGHEAASSGNLAGATYVPGAPNFGAFQSAQWIFTCTTLLTINIPATNESIAEIEYRAWTGDCKLRHAFSKGLREVG
jgi:hypothetical protein